MSIVHIYIGTPLFVAYAVILILGIFGLSVMQDCMFENDCDISPEDGSEIKSELTQEQYDALFIMMTAMPIITAVFFLYFMMFTRYDNRVIKGIKKELRGKKDDQ